MTNFYSNFHFLYPYWLLLIPLLLLLFFLLRFVLWRKNARFYVWDHFIDQQLQPYVLSEANQKRRHLGSIRQWLWGVGMLLAIVALAGPSWHKQKQAAYQVRQPGLVVVLDLSLSMLSEDMKPNRLQRAKFKLADLLRKRTKGETGLVVFAANAFTVSPLTTESTTLTAQVEHLSPSVMPAQGSRLDRAIEQAMQLLKQTGLVKGHILLFTDGVSQPQKAEVAAKKAYTANYTVSILAFATKEGGVIPLVGGGVVKNRQGEQVISRLDPPSLERIAQQGGGLYSEVHIDNQDIEQLMAFYDKKNVFLLMKDEQKKQTLNDEVNEGIWFLLPLIPLFLLLFRRGYLLLSPVFFLALIGQPQTVYAFEWTTLWLNDNQQAKKLFDQGQFTAAEKRFKDPRWKAVAAYRQQNYQQVQQWLATVDTADAWYNKGTALAKMGQLKEAVSALRIALKIQKNHQDARINLQIVQEALAAPMEKQSSTNNKQQKQKQKKNNHADNNKQESKMQNKSEPEKRAKDPLPKQSEAVRQQERENFNQQWLRSIPDDPSGLWRRKFQHQYQQGSYTEENEPW